MTSSLLNSRLAVALFFTATAALLFRRIRVKFWTASALSTAMEVKNNGASSNSRSTATTTSVQGWPGVICSRAWRNWSRYPSERRPLPCFHPTDHNANTTLRWNDGPVLQSPASTGLLFVKLVEVGGSSAVGVHLRIAEHLAQRRRSQQEFDEREREKRRKSTSYEKLLRKGQQDIYDMCKVRFTHGWAGDPLRKNFGRRDRSRSFMWSMVREPAARGISEYFHILSRGGAVPTDRGIITYLKTGRHTRYHHSLTWLSTSDRPYYGGKSNPVMTANSILKDYNFIGVTERFDESMVALKMILDVPMADILYVSSKVSGGYNDGQGGSLDCVKIQPSFVSPRVADFINSTEWQERIAPERAMYDAVAKSLDMTIENVLGGRAAFEEQVKLYKRAQNLVSQRCNATTVKVPCSNGAGPPLADHQTDCLWNDAGCGMKCLDRVADELELGW